MQILMVYSEIEDKPPYQFTWGLNKRRSRVHVITQCHTVQGKQYRVTSLCFGFLVNGESKLIRLAFTPSRDPQFVDSDYFTFAPALVKIVCQLALMQDGFRDLLFLSLYNRVIFIYSLFLFLFLSCESFQVKNRGQGKHLSSKFAWTNCVLAITQPAE